MKHGIGGDDCTACLVGSSQIADTGSDQIATTLIYIKIHLSNASISLHTGGSYKVLDSLN